MIAGLIRLLIGVQPRWTGVDPVREDGSIPQRIYFANHSSNLDAPAIWASLPKPLRDHTRPVAARDYWDATAPRRWLAQRVFHALLIERKHVCNTNNPLAAMESAIDAGASLIVFPEGTRSTDDDLEAGPFKPGLWHLAKHRPDVELVPVHLENLNRILPKGSLILIPLLAAVAFGKPIEIAEGEDKQAFLDRARRSVIDLERETEA